MAAETTSTTRRSKWPRQSTTSITSSSGQELQLFYSTGFNDRLHWIFGLYYFGEKGRHIDVVQLPGPPLWMPQVGVIMVDAKVDNTSKAAFGQFTYDLTPRFHLTLGARYTRTSRSASGPTRVL